MRNARQTITRRLYKIMRVRKATGILLLFIRFSPCWNRWLYLPVFYLSGLYPPVLSARLLFRWKEGLPGALPPEACIVNCMLPGVGPFCPNTWLYYWKIWCPAAADGNRPGFRENLWWCISRGGWFSNIPRDMKRKSYYLLYKKMSTFTMKLRKIYKK